MKTIKLNRIEIYNFKCIKEFKAEFDGNDIHIKGKNGAGKTTVFDAFTYLLFGKDSLYKSNCQVLPLNTEEHPNLNKHCYIEIELSVESDTIILSKNLEPKYEEFESGKSYLSGSTAKYFYNGIEFKKKEYESRINQIISLDLFRLLSNPLYFNSLHWKERRKILIDICDNISFDDIIKKDESLKRLKDLTDNIIDDFYKKSTQSVKKLHKQLEEYPIRFDECNIINNILEENHESNGGGVFVDERIEELEKKEKEILNELEEAEKKIYIIDKFYNKRAEVLENTINNKFDIAKFRMFKRQLNNELIECCDTMIDGVDYNNGLNTGMKINAGIDIINGLSKHYNISVPVFIDNRESVSELIDTDSQMINLSVDDSFETLTLTK